MSEIRITSEAWAGSSVTYILRAAGYLGYGTGTSSADPYIVTRGAVITWNHYSHNSDIGTTPSFSVPTFASYWVTQTNLVIPPLGSATSTISPTATLGLYSISVSGGSNYGNTYVYLQVVAAIDNVPTQFSLGSDVINATPNSEYLAATVVVQGINAPATAYVSNGATFVVHTAIPPLPTNYYTPPAPYTTTPKTVNIGDKILIRMTSSAGYGQMVSTVLAISGTTSTWRITTESQPAITSIISIGVTSPAPISLNTIKQFFGGDNKLSSYLKGGVNVPDIPSNINVPSALPLRLTDFYNASTALYFITPAINKSVYGMGLLFHNWVLGTDYTIGFANLANSVELMYTVISQSIDNPYNMTAVATDPIISTTTALNTWSTSNTSLGVSLNFSPALAVTYTGAIRISIRHPLDLTVVLTTDVNYILDFTGL